MIPKLTLAVGAIAAADPLHSSANHLIVLGAVVAAVSIVWQKVLKPLGQVAHQALKVYKHIEQDHRRVDQLHERTTELEIRGDVNERHVVAIGKALAVPRPPRRRPPRPA